MLHEEKSSSGLTGLIPTNPLGQRFTALFQYLWRFIYKESDQPWQTETRYRIEPRNLWAEWQNLTKLIGVRFGEFTAYGLFDIDSGSPYHPNNDPTALPRLRAALEAIGISKTLLIRSSDSGGLHLYICLESSVPTYGLALALRDCVQSVGFNLSPGSLEIFPNCKTFTANGTTDYQGHRLPLQAGSYLLDSDCQILSNDLRHFLRAWEIAAAGNDLSELKQAIATASEANKIVLFRSKGRSITQWKTDSERVISQGWTGEGQTNDLIKAIARHGRVFEELSGDALIEYTIEVAINSPGYREFCKHQRTIHRRVREWAVLIERRYVPYSSMLRGIREPKPDQRVERNSQASNGAIERIKTAVLNVGAKLTSTIRELAKEIANVARCSLGTLYKHLNLWHPEHCESNSQDQPTEPITALEPIVEETHPKPLEPLPRALLHPLTAKKVLNSVTPKIPSQKLKKQLVKLTPLQKGFDFCRNRHKKSPWKPLPGRVSRRFRLVWGFRLDFAQWE
jgi:hypothetical protein